MLSQLDTLQPKLEALLEVGISLVGFFSFIWIFMQISYPGVASVARNVGYELRKGSRSTRSREISS